MYLVVGLGNYEPQYLNTYHNLGFMVADLLAEKLNVNFTKTKCKAQIAETTSDYDREKLHERLAKLAGGVAVINVGAATEVEMK